MTDKIPNFSNLSSEVEASMIKVAGKWAIFLTDKIDPPVKLKPDDQVAAAELLTTLQINFEDSYNRIKDSVLPK